MKDKIKFISLGGIIVGIIGMLLPFYKDGEMFINGLGVISLVFLVFSLPFIFIYSSKKIAIIFLIVSSIIPVYKCYVEGISNVGIGFYVIIISILTAVISQILVKEKDEYDFDKPKEEVDLKYYQKPVKDFQRYSEVTKDGSFKRKEVSPPSVSTPMSNNIPTATNSMGYKGGLVPPKYPSGSGLSGNLYKKNH